MHESTMKTLGLVSSRDIKKSKREAILLRGGPEKQWILFARP